MNIAEIIAKYLREQGMVATARNNPGYGYYVSIKNNGIRTSIAIDENLLVECCAYASVSLYSPDSLEKIYKIMSNCGDLPCCQCEVKLEKTNKMPLMR